MECQRKLFPEPVSPLYSTVILCDAVRLAEKSDLLQLPRKYIHHASAELYLYHCLTSIRHQRDESTPSKRTNRRSRVKSTEKGLLFHLYFFFFKQKTAYEM